MHAAFMRPQGRRESWKGLGIGIGMRKVVCFMSSCLPTKKIVIKSVLAFGLFSAEMYKGFFFAVLNCMISTVE